MSIIGNYQIIENIGEGSFGKVFKAKHSRTDNEVAIKVQHKESAQVLKHEAKIYKYLNDISGVPTIRNYGIDNGFSYLVLDLLSHSLDNFELNHSDCIRHMLTAFNIIKQVHERGVIHRDIKPDNFLIKKDINGVYQLYLIDFGLSKLFMQSNKKHIEKKIDKKFVGTANYASVNIHNGIEASRRDDMESLCYTFISIYGHKLPWIKLTEKYKSDSQKKELYNEIKEMKTDSFDWLYDLPGEFITLLLYSRKLEFEEKPNYTYMCSVMNGLLLLN
jgi:serine/threonine protein kinase